MLYFVAFVNGIPNKNGIGGYGNTIIHTEEKITRPEELLAIQKDIENKTNLKKVTIINLSQL